MMKKIKALILLILLHGCATMPSQHPPLNQSMAWPSRRDQLAAINHWELQGAVAIKQQKSGVNARINWSENGKKYEIILSGPMASGSYQIKGSPGHATLVTPENKTFRYKNATSLIHQQTGWYLPIENLRYWIRGIPVPHVNMIQKHDEFNHLLVLHQQGWTIRYLSYTGVSGLDLPSKITLRNKNMKIRIVVKEWDI